MRNFTSWYKKNWPLVFFLALYLALSSLALSTIHIQPSQGGSMLPTIPSSGMVLTRDYLPWEKPQKGQVVVSDVPQRAIDTIPGFKKHPPNFSIGKRVAAIGGETVDGQVLPPDTYWLLGDNPNKSTDSRFFGPVPRSNITQQELFVLPPSLGTLFAQARCSYGGRQSEEYEFCHAMGSS
jgi:Signal peptidase, peptidase S26